MIHEINIEVYMFGVLRFDTKEQRKIELCNELYDMVKGKTKEVFISVLFIVI